MNTATLDRAAHSASAAISVATFSVVVLDGSGQEVYGVPVTARFGLDGGRVHTVTRVTGLDGEARFTPDLAGFSAVVLTAHGESLGPVHPRDGARLAVEA